jgi:Replication-relaxation
MDTITRRSRWTRDGTKVVELSPRDLEIFSLLQRIRYLRADYIHAFVGGSRTRLLERLNALYRFPNCYLDRPGQQRRYFNANHRPLIYELDRRGEDALQEAGLLDPGQSLAWFRRGHDGHMTFAHSVMVCEALSSIDLGIRARADLRFIPWADVLAAMPERTRSSNVTRCLPVSIQHTIAGVNHQLSKSLIPDAVFGIEYGGKGKRFFALECDRDHEPLYRSNLNQTSYLRKMLQYRQVVQEGIHKTHWGLPNLMVLNVTTSELHKGKMIELVKDLSGGRGNNYLLFRSMPSLGDFAPLPPASATLLLEPWERAGFGPFNISEP